MDFVDLKAQYRKIRPSLDKRLKAVLKHGQFILGPEVTDLEERLARYAGARHCLTCSSGTDALVMVLMAWNVGPGDAVFTTPFTFVATAEAAALVGATPVFVDIDPRTFNMDPKALAQAVAGLKKGEKPSPGSASGLKAKAVIPVNLFGLPADYDAISALAAENGLLVLEDAAQSFGAEYRGKKSGCLGRACATSFFPAKPLGCYGDGGAVFTDDSSLARVLSSIRVHGQGAHKYENVRIGLNGRLDTIQAAVLLSKLAVFDGELKKRRQLADRYTKALSSWVGTPFIPAGAASAWAQYSILTENRDAVMDSLSKQGIPTAIYYPKPLHLQAAFAYLGHKPGDFPVSEEISRKILSLPMHPYLSASDQDRIVKCVQRAVSEKTAAGRRGGRA